MAGFVAAAVIGPRLQRDREIDAPNNVAMVAVGAGLLWLGWNGFNGGDPYASNMSAAAAVLNTNLCTAVALLVWIAWDYLTGRKPSMIGTVNGMIVGLVAITPAAGYVNGWGAIAMGIIASTLVYFALNYMSRLRPFRNVDDTLGVIYTHGVAGLAGGLLVGVFADPQMALFYKTSKHGLIASGGVAGLIHGNATLLKWQFLAALFVICWTAVITFILLKLVGLVHPVADVREEHGDRRRRRARPRGLPVRRSVARVPEWDPGHRPGRMPCRPRQRPHDDSGRSGWEALLSASQPTPLAIVSRAVAGDDGLERVACSASDALAPSGRDRAPVAGGAGRLARGLDPRRGARRAGRSSRWRPRRVSRRATGSGRARRPDPDRKRGRRDRGGDPDQRLG